MWQEFKRILLDRRVIIMFTIILIINGYMFYDNSKNSSIDSLLYGTYNRENVDNYLELIDTYSGQDINDAYVKVVSILESGDASNYSYAFSQLFDQLKYLNEYKNIYPAIVESATKMSTTTLYSSGGFAENNIKKTVEDYKNVSDIELSLSNEKSISFLMKSSLLNYLNIFLMFIIVLVMLEERKKNLWNVVYSTKNGRCKIALYRVAIITICSAISTIFLFIENTIISINLYGTLGDLSRPVQCNMDFKDVTLNISMGEFIFQTLLWKILLIASIGLLLWFLSTILRRALFSYVLLILVLLLEYYLYKNIGPSSSNNLYLYANLFSFLDSSSMIATYKNLNLFGRAITLYDTMVYCTATIYIALAIITIVNGRKKPLISKSNIHINIFSILHVKLYKHMSLFVHELYKLFISQKILLVLIVFCIFIFRNIDTQKANYDYSINLYKNYIEQIQGPYTDEKKEYLEAELVKWNKRIEVAEQSLESDNELYDINNDSDYSSIENDDSALFNPESKVSEYEIKQLKISKKVVSALLDEANRLKALSDNGTSVAFIDNTGYNYLIGSKSTDSNLTNSIIILVLIIITLAGIHTIEQQSNIYPIIRTTKKGRISLTIRKYLIASITTTIILSIVFLTNLYSVSQIHGLSALSSAAQSLNILDDFALPFSISGALIFIFILRLLMAYSVMFIVLFISEHQKTIISSLIMNTIVLFLPAGLYYLGLDFFSKLSVINAMSVTNIWNTNGITSLSAILPFFILGLVGIIAAIFNNKSRLRKVVYSHGQRA